MGAPHTHKGDVSEDMLFGVRLEEIEREKEVVKKRNTVFYLSL